ncbi:MAG: hypothetical protein JWR80_4356, partial [Bradyrhizobium sp.]|nr:hypothetical protein [Bradyrhizobium sp.]
LNVANVRREAIALAGKFRRGA